MLWIGLPFYRSTFCWFSSCQSQKEKTFNAERMNERSRTGSEKQLAASLWTKTDLHNISYIRLKRKRGRIPSLWKAHSIIWHRLFWYRSFKRTPRRILFSDRIGFAGRTLSRPSTLSILMLENLASDKGEVTTETIVPNSWKAIRSVTFLRQLLQRLRQDSLHTTFQNKFAHKLTWEERLAETYVRLYRDLQASGEGLNGLRPAIHPSLRGTVTNLGRTHRF